MKLIAFAVFLSAGSLFGQSVVCTAVTRGAQTTCTASGGSHYTGWQFLGADGGVVTRTAIDSSTWKGVAVISGYVGVTVTTGSTNKMVTGLLQVGSRSGFVATPSAAKLELPGYSCKSSTGTVTTLLTVPSPPTAQNTEIGHYCNIDEYGFVPASVTDQGPNAGYQFVASATSLPQFHWTYTPDLMNTSSAFYVAQCGNYNASANTGFISGVQLVANTVNHESGTMNGHYGEWVSAYQAPVTNTSTVLESFAQLSSTQALFIKYVNQEMSPVLSTLSSEVATEPCNGYVTNDKNCKFEGPVNYTNAGGTYASCN